MTKLGEFIETGLQNDAEFHGQKNFAIALGFFRRSAVKFENGCREALFKLGQYYQYGIEVDRNI